MIAHPLVRLALLVSFSGSLNAAVFVIGDVGSAANTNNWPAGEPPAAAFDSDSGTKYLNFAKIDAGLIFSTTGAVVNGFAFTTANDSEARDPSSYVLYGSTTVINASTPASGMSYDLTNDFTLISSGSLTLPSARQDSSVSISFTNATGYETYILAFPTVKNEAGANSMQIARAMPTFDGGGVAVSNVNGGVIIPEPGSFILGALGLSAAFLFRRRRA